MVSTIPTIGFNVETIDYKNVSFTCWDVGGQDKIRCLWKHYYSNTDGLIFVVDSNDPRRLNAAKLELNKILGQDEMRDAAVLVLANKQDLPNARSAVEITQKLGLTTMAKRKWFVQPCSGITGGGLYEGLDWLSSALGKGS